MTDFITVDGVAAPIKLDPRSAELTASKEIRKRFYQHITMCVSVRETVIRKLAETVQEFSPVKTGMLRYNWQISLNAAATATVSRALYKKAKGTSDQWAMKEHIMPAINKWVSDTTYYLTNNVPYIRKAEYFGWGVQNWHPPYSMLQKTMAVADDIINETVRAARARK